MTTEWEVQSNSLNVSAWHFFMNWMRSSWYHKLTPHKIIKPVANSIHFTSIFITFYNRQRCRNNSYMIFQLSEHTSCSTSFRLPDSSRTFTGRKFSNNLKKTHLIPQSMSQWKIIKREQIFMYDVKLVEVSNL